jgi:FdhE protein
MTALTLDDWLRAHPFLATVAALHDTMDAAIAASIAPLRGPSDLVEYRADFLEGIPLLRSDAAAVDLAPAGPGIVAVVQALAESPVGHDARELREMLPDDGVAVIEWLLGDESWRPRHPGLLRCVGWRSLAAALAPVLSALAAWRDDERWLRRYCPACGSGPSMAQLVGGDPGHERWLHCGCCRTSWRFGRTQCPFCEADTHKRAAVTIDGDSRLRIDHCESCGGYLKTCVGRAGEAVLLADWTTLHLDLAAAERGWRRAASSLYAVGENTEPPEYRSTHDSPERIPGAGRLCAPETPVN